MFVKVSFRLKIGDLVDSNIMQLLQLNFAKSLVEELLNPSSESRQNDTIRNEVTPDNQTIQSCSRSNYSVEQPYPSQTMPESNTHTSHRTQEQPYMQEPNSYGTNPYQNQMPPQGINEYHSEPQHFGSTFPQGIQPNVQPAVFSSFEPFKLQEAEARNLDMLMDIPLQVTVELGRTRRSVKEILELSPGSIIELDKLAGEPVDILSE